MQEIFSPFGELMPNLSLFALNNTHFSDTNALGGYTQMYGTSWTIAGTIGIMCGIPLRMPIGNNRFNKEYFLANVTCLSDILATNNYHQVAIMGQDSAFAGTKSFCNTHNIQIRDINYYKDNNLLPKSYKVFWGMEDSKTLEFAKAFLNTNTNYPFALYISTIDTHIPHGFVDKMCWNNKPNYKNAIKCSDFMISEFVSWVESQDFAKDTTIVIVGDHLSMKQDNFFPPNSHRRIFNAFINPKFSNKNINNFNRNFSHFDMFPTILSALGFDIENDKLGLGVNLASNNKTLLEQFDKDDINKNLDRDSRIYDDFWEVNNAENNEK